MANYCSLFNGFCINYCKNGLCNYKHHCKLKINHIPDDNKRNIVKKEDNMKSIRFNADLIRAIECGLKTETRRMIKNSNPDPEYNVGEIYYIGEPWQEVYDSENNRYVFYKANFLQANIAIEMLWKDAKELKQEDARYKVKITNIRKERITDISIKDIEKEGFLYQDYYPDDFIIAEFGRYWQKIYGKSTFSKNVWCYVYSFELLK